MNIGERIKKVRLSRKLSQKRLSELAGIGEMTISQYERGKRQPRIEQLEKISAALNVPAPYLMGLNTSLYPDNIGEALKSFADAGLAANAWECIRGILAYMYGGIEERIIKGKYLSGSITVVGKGDSAFVLEDDDLYSLMEPIKNSIIPIIENLRERRKVEDIINEELAFFNSKAKIDEMLGGACDNAEKEE